LHIASMVGSVMKNMRTLLIQIWHVIWHHMHSNYSITDSGYIISTENDTPENMAFLHTHAL